MVVGVQDVAGSFRRKLMLTLSGVDMGIAYTHTIWWSRI